MARPEDGDDTEEAYQSDNLLPFIHFVSFYQRRPCRPHPEIKVCFFAPAQPGSDKLLLARSPELEYAVGKVSFDAFLKGYSGKRTQPYVALQGHPCMWSDEMFADFQHIVDLLLADGRTFVTPYEYYQLQGKVQTKR